MVKDTYSWVLCSSFSEYKIHIYCRAHWWMFFCHLYGAFLFLNSYTSAINNPVVLKHVKHDLSESYDIKKSKC